MGLVPIGVLLMLMSMIRPFTSSPPSGGSSFVCEDTHVAASASLANVNTAIAAADAGDCVSVPAGSADWSAGLSTLSGIGLIGPGKDAGSPTTITAGDGFMDITKHATNTTAVIGFRFFLSGSGTAILAVGDWDAEMVLFHDNYFESSSHNILRFESPGGLVFAENEIYAGWDDNLIVMKDVADTLSWTTADTMGSNDSDGKNNHYIETNDITGGTNTTLDCDDAARCVYRYNTALFSGIGSHGQDTSPIGMRHYEIYQNTWLYDTGQCSLTGPAGGTVLSNQNWLARVRGGTAVIFNNTMPDIANGCGWGSKPEIRFDLRGAEDVRPQGACGNVSYPVPHQVGQGNNGTSDFLDPIYMSTNDTPDLGLDWGWGNPCGFTFSDFVQENRDYYIEATKPGYSTYTYPHPLVPQ